MNNSLIGKYLVSKWGYSMILSTWVKVIRETPKTLIVQEVKSHSLTSEELEEKKLSPGWLQCYTVPTDVPVSHNGKEQPQFSVFKRTKKVGTIVTAAGPKENFVDMYVGRTPDSHYKHYFELWDGEPEFEDHCD